MWERRNATIARSRSSNRVQSHLQYWSCTRWWHIWRPETTLLFIQCEHQSLLQRICSWWIQLSVSITIGIGIETTAAIITGCNVTVPSHQPVRLRWRESARIMTSLMTTSLYFHNFGLGRCHYRWARTEEDPLYAVYLPLRDKYWEVCELACYLVAWQKCS